MSRVAFRHDVHRDHATAAIAIVVALPIEARTLVDSPPAPGECLALNATTVICVSGKGADRVERAAARLFERDVRALMSWGTAAGLVDDVNHGDLLLPEAIVSDRERLDVDPAWRHCLMTALSDGAVIRSGTLAESAQMLTSPTAKRELHASTGACACDMESAALARLARNADKPFLALRAVTDDVRTPLPACVAAATSPDGRIRPLAMLVELARRPGDVGPLLEVARGFRHARHSLERAARRIEPGFGFDPSRLEGEHE